jgi:ABC-2 type transport system ATP-binding protein
LNVEAQSGTSIAVDSVVCRLGRKTVLDGVDLLVRPGEIHAVLGPNGAGKTTLIRVLSGLVEPSQGSLTTAGTVGLVPSGDRSFYMRISALENLIFFGRLHGLRLRAARRRASEVLADVGLSEAANLPVGRCSHGMQKRLSVARALVVRPGTLLVDEATHDLDPEGARRIRSLVRNLTDQGTAVVWTTQRVEEVRNFADSITFLHQGKVRFTGSPAELADMAPNQRYVIRVRGNGPAHGPVPASLQMAVGGAATISPAGTGQEHFLLAPRGDGDLGTAVARLISAGYEVVACRQERAEIEEAFLALADEAAA